jgi:hypothetical protein
MNDVEAVLPGSEAAAAQTSQPVLDSGAPDLLMRRRAAAVLEVLGGAKSPAEAAEALGIALPSYYLLEARALEGLITSCEPRPRGRAAAEGRTFTALKRENDRLRQDLTRTQALTRAVQRAAGMPADKENSPADGRVRRRRRASARALRAARHLTAGTPDPTRPSLPTSPLAVESPP